MNKKGFTLIELITTFALAAGLIILLINIIVLIKDIYNQNNIKTKLIIEQSTLSKLMNEDFEAGLRYYNACDDSDFCYSFVFRDGDAAQLVVDDKKIKYGEYIYKFDKGVSVKNPKIERNYVDINDPSNADNFFTVTIPMYSKLYPKINFGIDLTIVGPEESDISKAVCSLNYGTLEEPGSKYECEVKPGTIYNFYVLSVEGDNVNLIMDRNLEEAGNDWVVYDDYRKNNTDGTSCPSQACADEGPITAIKNLTEATKDWVNIPNLNFTFTDAYYGTTTITGKARMPLYTEMDKVLCGLSCSWTIDYMEDSPLNHLYGTRGYYTLNAYNIEQIYYVTNAGSISTMNAYTSDYGIRPVITLNKAHF